MLRWCWKCESLQVEGTQEARKEQRKGVVGMVAVGLPAASEWSRRGCGRWRPEGQVGQALRV